MGLTKALSSMAGPESRGGVLVGGAMRAPRPTATLLAWTLFAASVLAGEKLIDDFGTGVEKWLPTMQYGKVAACKRSRGEGIDGPGALRLDYDFGSEGTNHIVYARKVDLDLSWADGLSFRVKGVGDRVMVFLFLWDSRGRFNNYGPHGTNRDFHTYHENSHTCRMSFDEDRSVQGGSANLADIKRIGFMLNQNGVRKGTVWIDSLACVDLSGSVALSPSTFSPNADGINDLLNIHAYPPRGTTMTLEILDQAGTTVKTLARDRQTDRRRLDVSWDGLGDSGAVPDGEYTVRAAFRGAVTAAAKATVAVDASHKWPELSYEADPFFPIGVWFEGAPVFTGHPGEPAGAKAYYERCFADLGLHGFNAVAVPNCPESLWEPLLQAAQEHGIKVVLEVRPLVHLVCRREPVLESEVYATAKRVFDKIGKYDSLLRYQVRDEPPPAMVPNWLLVQRILGAVDPKRPAFSCFCHSASLALVTSRTRLSEAVFDIYPHSVRTPAQSLGHFLSRLDQFKAAAKGNTPWAVLQTFAKPKVWRYPSEEELRAVTYLSLAAGAKGVFYFIYQSMPNHPEKLEGLVDATGRPTPMYAPAERVARELRKLAPLVLALKPVEKPINVQGDARVGSFVDAQGHAALLVASTRPDKPVVARVGIREPLAWRDTLGRESFESRDGVLAIPLEPGAGRLLVAQ